MTCKGSAPLQDPQGRGPEMDVFQLAGKDAHNQSK